jgi:hypothetical protein
VESFQFLLADHLIRSTEKIGGNPARYLAFWGLPGGPLIPVILWAGALQERPDSIETLRLSIGLAASNALKAPTPLFGSGKNGGKTERTPSRTKK